MQIGFFSIHLKISVLASTTMAKCGHYVAMSQTEELICDLILSSSVFQRTLMLKLLMIYQMILTTVFQNISCGMIADMKLGLNCCAVPHISPDSSP
jgi:hypothetical protein